MTDSSPLKERTTRMLEHPKHGYYRAGGPPICEEGWVAAPCNDFALSRSISVASTQALMGSPSEHLAAILVSPTRRKNLAPLS